MNKIKKTIYALLACLILSFGAAFANDKDDILKVFENYVKDANSYSSTIPDYYVENAKIVRVVNKKQGGQKEVLIPFDRYLKELKKNQTLAKTVAYKNNYKNQKVLKINDSKYKLTAIRVPRNDKTGLPCYFVFVKTAKGWKIQEESMTTNVQTFLNAK